MLTPFEADFAAQFNEGTRFKNRSEISDFKMDHLVHFKDGSYALVAEQFIFDDGEKQSRTWKIKLSDDNNFIASAGDVVGEATGRQYGNTLRMDYVLRTPVGEKTYDLTIEDWIYLIDEQHAINESKLKKFGVTVGYLTLGFNKL